MVRNCRNCALSDGCKGAVHFDVCSEHCFEWELASGNHADDLSEIEKKSIIGDKKYQAFKEDDL